MADWAKSVKYENLYKSSWRGFYDGRYRTEQKDMNFIQASRAVSYNDLLNEAIALKKAELDAHGGQPFYEPSTFYGSYREPHYHSEYQWAASRYASGLYSTYYRFQKEGVKGTRTAPDNLPDSVGQLWTLINAVSEKEPWAWPMMQLQDGWYADKFIAEIPVLQEIKDSYIALGHTEDEFKHALIEVRGLIRSRGYH
jgi:hypothetical protein